MNAGLAPNIFQVKSHQARKSTKRSLAEFVTSKERQGEERYLKGTLSIGNKETPKATAVHKADTLDVDLI